MKWNLKGVVLKDFKGGAFLEFFYRGTAIEWCRKTGEPKKASKLKHVHFQKKTIWKSH